MPADRTVPSRTFRRLTRGTSAISTLGLALGCLDLALAQDGVDARDVLAHLAEAGVVVELARDVLEAEVEEFLLRLGELVEQLLVVHLAQLRDARHQISSARVTNLALTGSFWIARSSASRASVS